MRLRPLGRRDQTGAAVQVRRLAAARIPHPGGVAELPVQADALPILLQPAAQGRPLADEDLVGHLRGVLFRASRAGRRRAARAAPAPRWGDTPSGTSSLERTRRRVAALPSPSSVSRRNTLRASRCASGDSVAEQLVGGLGHARPPTPPLSR